MIQSTVSRFLTLILISNVCFALPEDRQEIMHLSSETVDISQEKHKGYFKGDVKLDQGTTHLRAAEATTETNASNKLTKAIIKGNTKKQAHYWSLITRDKPELHAWANIIQYFPEKNRIELIGNAKIKQGNSIFKAPKIIYDTLKQHVLTQSDGKASTTITLYPQGGLSMQNPEFVAPPSKGVKKN